ncbi:MAG TPA: hypothetical protein VFE47_30485 [Tepidisphaeraceae bacterium]|jgi:hypothetical protein|nr:hypothetical protein [Tepidisphaeraceae bacterium]
MTQTDIKPKRRIPWTPVAVIAGLALVTFVSWWLLGRKVWTDDRGVKVVDGQAKLREVLWDPPKPLGELFEGDQHYEPSFSPDGSELYFVKGKPAHNADIFVSYRRNNQWTKPEPVAAINTPYDELGPRVSADGKFLLFYSDRPGGFGGYDIWASPRTKEGWGKPFNLGPNVNSEFNEFTPDATPDGKHLIFATNRVAAKRQQLQNWRATIRENDDSDYDLWIAELQEPGAAAAEVARPLGEPPTSNPATGPSTEPANVSETTTTSPSGTTESVATTQPTAPTIDSTSALTIPTTAPATVATTQPTTLPALSSEPISPELTFGPAHEIPGINTPFVEGASCMSPAGDFLYFASNRPGGFGKFDIWRCRVSTDWKFGPVENAGAEINSADNETDPALAFNGYRLIFSSDRGSTDGVYRLFSSDSREVYSMRQLRPLPHVGRSFWIFLASVLAMIPLLFMLRGWDSGKLSILQRCLLISLLVHVLLCLWLSFVTLMGIPVPGAKALGLEVTINLNPSPEIEEGTAIRRQSTTGDLPTMGAPPSAQRVMQTPLETAMARGPVDVALPRANVMPEPTMAAADVTRNLPPVKPDSVAPQAAAPQAELPQNDAPDVHIHSPAALTQADARPQVQPTAAPAARAATESPTIQPRPVPTPAAPVAQANPAPLPLEPGPLARPNLPAGGITSVAHVTTEVSPTSTSAPLVNIAQNPAAKVVGNDAAPAASAAAPSATSPGRLQTASAQVTQGAKASVIPADAPLRPDAAQNATPSIVTPGAFKPAAGPVVEGAAAPGTSNLVSAPDVNAPKPATPPIRVASGRPDAPVAQEASVGQVRQGSAVASAKATGIEVPVPRAATAQAASVGGPVVAGVSDSVRPIAAGPTTLPSQAIAANIIPAPASPQVNIPEAAAPGPRAAVADRPLLTDAAGPAATSSGPIANAAAPSASGPSQVGVANAPIRPDAGSSIAAAEVPATASTGVRGVVVPGVSGPSAAIPDAIEGPTISLPAPMAGLPSPSPAAAGAGPNAPEPVAGALAGKQTLHGPQGGGKTNVPIEIPGPVLAGAQLPKESGSGLDPVSARPHFTQVASTPAPRVDFDPLPSDINAGKLNAPDSPFQMRAPEVHRPIIEKLGGNKQSEDAVARALFWLSENQERNGRWTIIFDRRGGGRRGTQHDTALTGLSLLAFLAQDNRPDKAGPYRETVTRGLDYLVSAQRPDGDLRGDSPGGGANQSNMYDHGIATYAMAEAAILSHDPRYIAAALKGAEFIVKAQNQQSGGWRYAPRESADTSVFGWQVMALHSAEQIGFVIPEQTKNGIDHYIEEATSGRYKMLAAYQPHAGPTPTMTAQMAFTRMLLGRQLSEDEMGEASDFLSRTPPSARDVDLYYWYYASLCMSQMKTPAWKTWNQKTRDALIAMQKPDGEHSGFWESNNRKGENVGRVFSTALGALTLEVYYRYMPLEHNAAPQIRKSE